MADTQLPQPPQNMSSGPNKQQNQDLQKDFAKMAPPRNAQKFEVSNYFLNNDRRQPAEVIFCRHNPLHVVSITRQEIHEKKECPDRKWNPGEKIISFSDFLTT